ncbi:MAG: glycoside hydrolase family 3 C-terminal domain-containing protein [Acidimicrobiales bacterium]
MHEVAPIPSSTGDRAAATAAAMTVREQALLTTGADNWHTRPLPRLGVPALRFSDGPNGVRGTRSDHGPTSAAFPVAAALGATWDVDLVHEVGAALAVEAEDKGVDVLLAPTLNLHRHPLAGRNFECFSEDPCLASRMAVAFISGVQRAGVAATAKHLVANDSEVDRYTMSSDIAERALREVYLAPFEAAVREAGVWAVMTAYNRLNGVACSADAWLIEQVLRREWGFDGLVMSDWFGTYERLGPARAGLDLEMPGPGLHLGVALADDVAAGRLDPAELRAKTERLLGLIARTAGRRPEADRDRPERSVDRPEVWALARRAAVGSMVLLRNDGVLPLRRADAARVAVIGPNASPGQVGGGGSSHVRPHRVSEPLAALREYFGPGVEVVHEPGCRTNRLCPVLAPWTFSVETFASLEPSGEPVAVGEVDEIGADLADPDLPGVDPQAWSQTYRAAWIPRRSGRHTFGITAIGRSRVFVDGELVADNWTDPQPGHTFYANGSTEVRGSVELEAARPVSLRVDYQRDQVLYPGIRLGVEEPDPYDLFDWAVEAARAADLVIMVVGSNAEWETEGTDRVDLQLPGRQNQLVDAVLAANRNTVVVVNAGSPTAMVWANRAAAVLQAWYPGMAFGEALVDVLSGMVNPSGRLPTTFPHRLEDHPAYLNYPPEGGRMAYGEGVFIGYRGFDARDIEPQFPFGFGLSYTTFEYGPLTATFDPVGRRVVAEVEITNTGERAGAEVVQLYVSDEAATVSRPPKELRAFRRVDLEPGRSEKVRFELDERAFAFWHPRTAAWTVEPGRFGLLVGSSSRDIRSRAAVLWG